MTRRNNGDVILYYGVPARLVRAEVTCCRKPRRPANRVLRPLYLCIVLCGAVFTALSVCGCGPRTTEPVALSRTRLMMGTQVTVTVFAADGKARLRAVEAAFDRISAVERLMSAHDPESELSRVNAEAADTPVAVSAEMFDVLAKAGRHYRLSQGAFDVTVMPLVRLWTAAAEAGRAPSQEALKRTLEAVGYDKLVLDAEKRTVGFSREGMGLALGGIAKGYAVDLAVEALRRAGVTSAVVDAGGDIRVLGRHPTGRTWLIGLRNPFSDDDKPLKTLDLADCAVATSGDYERSYTIAGKRYSHIFDPRTGLSVRDAHSVTVVAPDATQADALATAVSVLGPERGIALVETIPSTECFFISGTAAQTSFRMSSGFEKLLSVGGK